MLNTLKVMLNVHRQLHSNGVGRMTVAAALLPTVAHQCKAAVSIALDDGPGRYAGWR